MQTLLIKPVKDQTLLGRAHREYAIGYAAISVDEMRVAMMVRLEALEKERKQLDPQGAFHIHDRNQAGRLWSPYMAGLLAGYKDQHRKR